MQNIKPFYEAQSINFPFITILSQIMYLLNVVILIYLLF